MKFWDASALIALVVEEPHTAAVRDIAKSDPAMVVWWGSPVECCSAFARLRRDGAVNCKEEDRMRHLVSILSDSWAEIQPGTEVRTTAERLLLAHPLRAADSLQLAAALTWAGRMTRGRHFICLDQRLREAARNEGFTIIPEELD